MENIIVARNLKRDFKSKTGVIMGRDIETEEKLIRENINFVFCFSISTRFNIGNDVYESNF